MFDKKFNSLSFEMFGVLKYFSVGEPFHVYTLTTIGELTTYIVRFTDLFKEGNILR